MQKLVIEFSNERLITPSGLSLVGQMLGKSNFIKKCNNMKIDGKRSQSQIKNGDILLSYIGLLCQGKTAYECIRETADDPEYYKLALGITRSIPSAETLRQRMDDIGSSLRNEILSANVEMFKTYNIKPSALDSDLVPLDLDVTPMDNSKTFKEGVSYTYKGFVGYAPMMAYIGKDAILKVKEYAEQGYTFAVVLDLSKYFDTLNHEILIKLLRKNVKDERVVQLIKRYLKSGVMENGVVIDTEEGSPQGGNLSPLLANVL